VTDHPVVIACDLTKRFDTDAGVFDVDIDVSGGEIVALIGPSGSGKTTTVRLMTGLLTPDSGSVTVFGEEPGKFTSATRGRIGYMAQESVFFPDLTVRENLNFAASLFGVPLRRRRRVDETVEMLGLEEAIDRPLRDVSGGEKRRLSLAAALIHDPHLLFLDEPTAGIDPILRRRFWEHFESLAEKSAAMLVTTQYVGEAAYCDYVGVLAAGRILALETPEDLRRQAFGGELFDVELTTPPTPGDVDKLARGSAVQAVKWLDDHSIRLVVEDAGAMSSTVVEWAGQAGLEIERSETYLPPFDDVFVEIVSRRAPPADEAPDEPLAVVGAAPA
jgi:ABC-2 type transport system ATP-binding protein